MRNWVAGIVLASAATGASSQEIDPVEMLGGFDQIAEACVPGGSEAALTAVRIRLFRQTIDSLGGSKKALSDQEIGEAMAATRKGIADDSSGALARRYDSGRRGVSDMTRLAQTKPAEFDRVCKAARSLRPDSMGAAAAI